MTNGHEIGIGITAAGGGDAPPWWVGLVAYSPLLMLTADVGTWSDAARTTHVLDTADLDTWDNLGSSSINATDAGGNKPSWTATGGVSGGPGVVIDDSNTELMEIVGLTNASNDYTVFAVYKQVSLSPVRQALFGSNTAGLRIMADRNDRVDVHDGTSFRDGMMAITGDQLTTWAFDASGGKIRYYRDGPQLQESNYDGTWEWGATAEIGSYPGSTDYADVVLSFFMIVPSLLSDADRNAIHAILLDHFELAFTAQTFADIGLAWDADDATLSGSDIATLTDTSGNGHTINLVGTVPAVTIGSHQYCRFNGSNNGLQIADDATLDGAAGCTHVLRIANASGILGTAATVAQKGRAGTHINGGIGDTAGGGGTRFAALMNSADELDDGPVPSGVADTEESLAMAIDSAAAIRRVDPDDTYATNATAATITVGVGSLTYGMQETGVGTYDEHADADVSAGLYFARDLNQWELLAAKTLLDP